MAGSSCSRPAGTCNVAPGSTTWRLSAPTKTIRRRSSSGTRTVSAATSVSRTITTSPRHTPTRPHGPTTAPPANVVTVRAARTWRNTAAAIGLGRRQIQRSYGRRASIRAPAAWSARSAIRCAISSPTGIARATTTSITFSRSSSTDRERTRIRRTGPTAGPAVSPMTPSGSGRAPVFSAAARPAPAAIATRICLTSTRTRSSAPRAMRSAPAATRRSPRR